jgi:hypothetical protein
VLTSGGVTILQAQQNAFIQNGTLTQKSGRGIKHAQQDLGSVPDWAMGFATQWGAPGKRSINV